MKCVFFLSICLGVSNCLLAQERLFEGLVGCYDLDGSADDGSDNENHGLIFGATPTKDRFGKDNGAYYFDGFNDHISIPATTLKNSSYSYAVWAKVSSNPYEGESGIVFSIGDRFDSKHQTINVSNVYANDGFVGWNVGGYNDGIPTTTSLQSFEMPNINEWYHLAMTRDNNLMKMYINGVLITTGATNGNPPYYGNYTTAHLGLRCNFSQPFHGSIDDFVIYDRVLDEQEIAFLFSNGLPCGGIVVPNVSACGAGNVILTASGGDSYLWFNEGGDLLFEGNPFIPELSESARFYIQGEREGVNLPGEWVDVTINSIPEFSVNFPDEVNTDALNLFQIQMESGKTPDNLVWEFDADVIESTSLEIQYVFSAPGMHHVKVTAYDHNGCSYAIEQGVNVIDNLEVNLYEGLIGCYNLNGDAKDRSGSENHGTVYGAISARDRFNQQNSAYSFDGLDDYISIPTNTLKNNSYTFAVWAKVISNPDMGNSGIVFSIGDRYDSKHQTINVSNVYASDEFVGWNVGGYNEGYPTTTSLQSKIMPTVGVWYHLAMTRTNDVMKMYLNGQLISLGFTNGTSPYFGSNTTAHLGLRCNFVQGFHGEIDDFVIYDRELNSKEIYALYEKGLPCDEILLAYQPRCGSGTVEVLANGAETYNWYNEEGHILFTGNPFLVELSEATRLYVEGIRGTKIFPKKELLLEFNPEPEAACISTEYPEIHEETGVSVDVTSGTGPYSYEWSVDGVRDPEFMSSEYKFIPESSIENLIEVVVIDANGCMSTCSALIVANSYFFIPNVISVNDDQINEVFNLFRIIDNNILPYEGSKPFSLQIFNRWGKPLYSTNIPAAGWRADGHPSGIYYYTIKLDKVKYNGWVNVIKP